jgi:uncharacterized protein YbaP (TraB family)
MSSLLWSLHSPEGQQSWLFGSMHIRDDRVHQFGKKLYPLILSSNRYIGEMELDATPSISFSQQPYDLKGFFRPNVFEKIKSSLLKSFGVDVEPLNAMHPLMIMSAISQGILAAEHQVSLDEHLWQFAVQHDKQVSGLESYEEQFSILHNIDPASLYRQLYKISKSPSGMRRQTSRALEWYLQGNAHKLYQLTKASMHKLRKSVIYERNQQMTLRIRSLDPASTYFIVIGAGHLSGNKGVIPLLKRSGWKVKPVDLVL